jgi:hypothetical protein
MSLEYNLFVEYIDDSIIPRWMKRMNQFDMKCEIYPKFSFSEHSGFLPFKINLKKSKHPELVDNDFLTGFEFYLNDFDLELELEKLKPKQSAFSKFLGKKEAEVYFASPEIEEKLKKCKKVISFIWGAADTFELRMAYLSSVVLAELTNGICCYPADNIWYDNRNIVLAAVTEIIEYEESLKPSEFKLHIFNKWL